MDYYDTFADRYAKGIIEGQKAGEVKDIDHILISYFLMGVSNFIGLKYVMFDDNNRDFDQVVDKVIDIIESGLFNKPVQ